MLFLPLSLLLRATFALSCLQGFTKQYKAKRITKPKNYSHLSHCSQRSIGQTCTEQRSERDGSCGTRAAADLGKRWSGWCLFHELMFHSFLWSCKYAPLRFLCVINVSPTCSPLKHWRSNARPPTGSGGVTDAERTSCRLTVLRMQPLTSSGFGQ